MTLYTHFDNKGELLDLMYAEVARQLYEDKGNPTWQAELLAVCRHYRAKLVEHPKWAPLLARPAHSRLAYKCPANADRQATGGVIRLR